MTDEELDRAIALARKDAHDAPKCISGTADAPFVSGDAWARHAREWIRLCELKRQRADLA